MLLVLRPGYGALDEEGNLWISAGFPGGTRYWIEAGGRPVALEDDELEALWRAREGLETLAVAAWSAARRGLLEAVQ